MLPEGLHTGEEKGLVLPPLTAKYVAMLECEECHAGVPPKACTLEKDLILWPVAGELQM